MRGVQGLHCVKRLSATLQEAGGRVRLVREGKKGGGGCLYSFTEKNRTNWIWSIVEPLGKACCLRYGRLRWDTDWTKTGSRKKKRKKKGLSVYIRKWGGGRKLIFSIHISVSISPPKCLPVVYQSDVTPVLLPNCNRTSPSVCEVPAT